MLDLQDRFIDVQPNEFDDQGVPRFEDVYEVFMSLTENILGTIQHTSFGWCNENLNENFELFFCISDARQLLQIRPVHKKQQENFDRVLKCVTHLIYLLVKCAKEEHEKRLVFNSVQNLVLGNIRSACTNDTLLHLCVSRLNVIKSSYFQYENITRVRHSVTELSVV